MSITPDTPMCRTCGQRNIITPATWVMSSDAIRNHYLCDHHQMLLATASHLRSVQFTQLPNAAEMRGHIPSSYY